MPKQHRLVGLPLGAVDTEKKEIQFDLQDTDGTVHKYVSRYGPICQMISGLGRMVWQLRCLLDAEKGMEGTSAETVMASHVQKDRWQDVVLMQLTTQEGVPYAFAMPSHVAAGIAEQLKTESAKPHQVGHA